MAGQQQVMIVLGNQLFAPGHLDPVRGATVFMAEDMGLCTYVEHHQQKIVLFLAAMRAYAEELREAGFEVHYCRLDPDDDRSYEDRLHELMNELGANSLACFEIEDKAMESRIEAFAGKRDFELEVMRSPMFLCSRSEFADYVKDREKLLMADFYKRQRRRLGYLVDEEGNPDGGQWSFDAENRKKLPARVSPPRVSDAPGHPCVEEVIELVSTQFGEHPGRAGDFWWPVTRAGARQWLDDFLVQRLACFGPYEDAISTRSETVFHSLLSPIINMGLLTPDEVVSAAVEHAEKESVPLQSLEGLVRQLIGWREFVRGVYRHFSERQDQENFFDHERELTVDWYAGTTGILPLDDAIETAQRLGWLHHIPRLMVVANLMNLCEIRPQTAHDWFMEMFVDSSEWVMGPNVYGMGLFSDGGIFATKPYICGSNYLLKMSDYRKGEWCEVVDGLYWRFIDRHRDFFQGNPRLALMPRALDRLKPERKDRIFEAAEGFLAAYTC